VLLYAHRFDEARALVEELHATQPGYAGALIVRARVDAAQERYADALEAVSQASRLSNGGVAVEVTRLQLLARAGREAEARAGMKALEAQAASGAVRVSHRDRAYLHLALGDAARACDELEQSFANRESTLRWIAVDPRLDELHGNPRFTAILDRMGLR